MTKGNKRVLIGCALLIAVTALLTLAYFHFTPKSEKSEKQISVNIVTGGEGEGKFAFQTDREYLRQALEDQKLISGREDTYGLYVQTVNGVTADESQEQWWLFTKNGRELLTGVDTTPIADGDIVTITLKTGW